MSQKPDSLSYRLSILSYVLALLAAVTLPTPAQVRDRHVLLTNWPVPSYWALAGRDGNYSEKQPAT